MRRVAVLTAGVVMAATLGIIGFGGVAGASRSAHVSSGMSAGQIISAKKGPPVVEIVTPGPVYNPTSVTGKKVTSKKCGKTNKKFSFVIANTTSVDQQVVETGGGDFGPPIPAGEALGVCAAVKGSATDLFTLASNSSASLDVTIK